jgi:hypothetical protein
MNKTISALILEQEAAIAADGIALTSDEAAKHLLKCWCARLIRSERGDSRRENRR